MFRSSQAPLRRPQNAYFSSGPCAKRPGWTPAALNDAAVGRPHRSKAGRAKLKEVIGLTRTVLGIPDDYRGAIVPGSDTGAVEMALWSLPSITVAASVSGGPCRLRLGGSGARRTMR